MIPIGKVLPWVLVMLAAAPAAKPDNRLTEAEKKDGWRLLFDGKTTEGWRGYKMDKMPPGWQVIDGALVRVSGGAGGKGAGGGDDVITVEQFDDFELRLEWKIVDRAGNSGIVLRASEDAVTSWHTGPEMQILDNAAYPGRSVRQLAGACYDLYAPSKDVWRPRGEWNAVRVVADGRHVEHWLNGVKLLEYELGGDDWNRRVAKSKFKNMKHFQEPPTRGYLCLQDHTARIEYRNIKIRPLRRKTQPAGQETQKHSASLEPGQEQSSRQALDMLGNSYVFKVDQPEPDIAAARRILDLLKAKCAKMSGLKEASLAAISEDPDISYVRVIPADRAKDYRTLAAVLGKAESQREGKLVSMGTLNCQVVWHKHGWLEIGVADGKVVAVQADCSRLSETNP